MNLLFQKFRKSLDENSSTAVTVFFLYGMFLFYILFNTAHNRSDEEWEKKMIPRFNKTIMVWIDHGYFSHGGLAFEKPVKEDPSQSVWGSNTLNYLQFAHLLQRIHVAVRGEFGYFLMALHNQFFPMLSSILLGILAMRLTLQLKIHSWHALILGLSVLTVFQTFPVNLVVIWENGSQVVWQTFVVLFILREDHMNWKGYAGKNNSIWTFMVFLMFCIEPCTTFFFMFSYFIILLITMPKNVEVYKFINSTLLAMSCALLIILIQFAWVMFNYPKVTFHASSLLHRTGFDGDTQYYSSHLDLLLTSFSPWLPRWKILLFFGILATMAVICLVQLKRKHLNYQTTLLMGIASFIPMSFFFSQNGALHPQFYEHLLAFPLILALFALLPAWLESLNRNSGTFVLFSGLTAFAFSGLQILAYWLHMPPNIFWLGL
jgi:hypothetical protein